MSLSILIYSTPARDVLLADLTGRAQRVTFGTGRHGFAGFRAFVPATLEEAFVIYGWPGTPHLLICDGAASVVWEGRLEDIAIVPGGVRLGALGYWRALADVPYTALWSLRSTAPWRVESEDTIATHKPKKFDFDNNNRLFISLTKDTSYSQFDAGGWVFWEPHPGIRDIVNVSFDYVFNCSSDFTARLRSNAEDYVTGSTDWTLAGDGTSQSGSASISTSAPAVILQFIVIKTTAGSVTYTGESGAAFLRISNLRIKTTSASTVLASDIAAALAVYVNGINSSQLSASSALITATSTDLRDELYEDAYPADILDRLALLHNYQAAVYEGRRLIFQPKTTAGRTWYVDVARIVDLQRSLDPLRNSAYAIYREAGGRRLRTAVANNALSQARYGLARRGAVSVQTTSQTEAQTHRAAWLSDRSDYAVRAGIEFERIYDDAGAPWPLYAIRAGDRLVMRNLPPTLSTDVDNIRSFRVAGTDYDVDGDAIRVEPETPTPTLVTLLARRGAGL